MKYPSKGLLLLAGIFLVLGFVPKTNHVFFIVIAALLVGVYYYLQSFLKEVESEMEVQHSFRDTQYLMKNGIAIKVDFNNCSIVDTSYQEEIINEGYSYMDKYRALDALSGRDTRTFSQITQCVIVYQHSITGKVIKFFSEPIPKDRHTLALYLSEKQFTWLYVEPTNMNNYYFDLDFLN